MKFNTGTQEDFKEVDPGTYFVFAEDMSIRKNERLDCDELHIQFSIAYPKFVNQKVWDDFPFTEKLIWKLEKLLKIAGVEDGDFDTETFAFNEALKDVYFKVQLGHREHNGKKYVQVKNHANIDKYFQQFLNNQDLERLKKQDYIYANYLLAQT